MADAVSVQIAKAVVARLNAGEYDTDFTAVRRRLVEWDRDELVDLQVSVVSGDVASEPGNRTKDQNDHEIHIGLQQLVDPLDLTVVDGLELLAEQIRDRLRGVPLTIASGRANWLRAEYRVPWDPGSLKQSEYLGLVVVSYRVVR